MFFSVQVHQSVHFFLCPAYLHVRTVLRKYLSVYEILQAARPKKRNHSVLGINAKPNGSNYIRLMALGMILGQHKEWRQGGIKAETKAEKVTKEKNHLISISLFCYLCEWNSALCKESTTRQYLIFHHSMHNSNVFIT